MPKSDGQKVRIVHIMKILQQETDEKHFITTGELIDRLAATETEEAVEK